MPSTDSNMSTTDIDEVDERLRSKYMDILQSLSVADLKRFQLDKHRYEGCQESSWTPIIKASNETDFDIYHYISLK